MVTHGKPQTIGPALARLATVAREAGVELRWARTRPRSTGSSRAEPAATSTSRSCSAATGRCSARSHRFLGTGVPVIGVNFGRVGFLSSIARDELESGLARVFAGEYKVEELPTLDVEVGDERRVAVNDLVVASADVGRMIELEWAVGGEELGRPAATASSARPRRARRATTSRTAARCSCGASTRWRSRSSRRTR